MNVKIPTAENISLKLEDGYISSGPSLMTDAGDHLTFTTAGTRFSLCEKDENGIDRRPVVRPDGLRNGCLVYPALSGVNDAVDICGGSICIGGAVVLVNAVSNLAVTRPSSSNVKIVSIIADATATLLTLDGAEGATVSAVRGANGGPPFIPLGKVELAAITLLTSASAKILDKEISFKPELSHMPEAEIFPYKAKVRFRSGLPLIHTGLVTANVYITYCEPQLAFLDVVSFRPPVMAAEFDFAIGKLSAGKVKSGLTKLNLSAQQADLIRRADGTIRFIEFMPDSSGSRKELYYAHLETSALYSPGSVMEGEINLLPCQKPSVETV